MSEIIPGQTEEQNVSIPYFVHEGEMSRLERLNKRWFIAFLISIIMLFVTNAGWIVYESQFETVQVSQEASSETGDSTTLLTTGEGSVTYYGNAREAGNTIPGTEDEQRQSE